MESTALVYLRLLTFRLFNFAPLPHIMPPDFLGFSSLKRVASPCEPLGDRVRFWCMAAPMPSRHQPPFIKQYPLLTIDIGVMLAVIR